MTPMQLDNYYAAILVEPPGTSMENYVSDSEGDISTSETHSDHDPPTVTPSPMKPAPEVLNELAAQIDDGSLSKFNIARNFMWEGAKRAVSRKAFLPANKVSVKFTDDSGASEGAIDWESSLP